MTTVAEPTKKQKKVNAADAVAGQMQPMHSHKAATDGQPAQATTPKPGEPGFDWQPEYPGETIFTYTRDDVTIGLATISKKRQPTIGFIEDAQDLDEFAQVMRMARFVACDEAWTILRDWVPSDLMDMWAEWSKFNRDNAGE